MTTLKTMTFEDALEEYHKSLASLSISEMWDARYALVAAHEAAIASARLEQRESWAPYSEHLQNCASFQDELCDCGFTALVDSITAPSKEDTSK